MNTAATLDRSKFLSRACLLALWGTLSLLILLPPVLSRCGWPLLSALDYLLFSPLCHQAPERSFSAGGYAWAVCHRCSGIYFGLFITLLVPFGLATMLSAPERRRTWVLAAATPLMLDVLLAAAGLWQNTPLSRFASGFLFGTMLATILLPACAEWIDTLSRTASPTINADPSGGMK